MSPMEAAKELGTGAIDALKGSPALLVITIFLTLYIGLESYLAMQERDRWKELVETAMKWCPASAYERPKQ